METKTLCPVCGEPLNGNYNHDTANTDYECKECGFFGINNEWVYIPSEEGEKLDITLENGNTISGYFDCCRIGDGKQHQDGWCKYEIRHSDNDDSVFATIEKKVAVNFAGTFLTKETIDFADNDHLQIVGWNFLG